MSDGQPSGGPGPRFRMVQGRHLSEPRAHANSPVHQGSPIPTAAQPLRNSSAATPQVRFAIRVLIIIIILFIR